jgi:hypothetical protein
VRDESHIKAKRLEPRTRPSTTLASAVEIHGPSPVVEMLSTKPAKSHFVSMLDYHVLGVPETKSSLAPAVTEIAVFSCS